jgi:hypothetical protein
MTADPALLLADHPLLTAAPFFVPAFVIAAVVIGVVVGDRRRARTERQEQDRA